MEKKVVNTLKSLKGVSVIGKVHKSKSGRLTYKFSTPYDDKILRSRGGRGILGYKKHLKSIGKSPKQLILDINNLTEDDLPKCMICNRKNVLIGGYSNPAKGVNLLYPKILDICNNPSCSRSYALLNRLKEGTHPSQTMSSSEKSIAARKANYSALTNGNHVSQSNYNFNHKVKYNLNTYHFKSNAEIRFFLKFKRILTKYYLREKQASKYIYKREKVYIPDYSLKSEFSGKLVKGYILPDFIEVKGGNLYSDGFHKEEVFLINKAKFKSILDLNKSIYVVDLGRSAKSLMRTIKLHSHSDIGLIEKN